MSPKRALIIVTHLLSPIVVLQTLPFARFMFTSKQFLVKLPRGALLSVVDTLHPSPEKLHLPPGPVAMVAVPAAVLAAAVVAAITGPLPVRHPLPMKHLSPSNLTSV